MNAAFEYIKQNNGIDTEKSYPYEAFDGKCRFKPEDVAATDVVSIIWKKKNKELLYVFFIGLCLYQRKERNRFYKCYCYSWSHCYCY